MTIEFDSFAGGLSGDFIESPLHDRGAQAGASARAAGFPLSMKFNNDMDQRLGLTNVENLVDDISRISECRVVLAGLYNELVFPTSTEPHFFLPENYTKIAQWVQGGGRLWCQASWTVEGNPDAGFNSQYRLALAGLLAAVGSSLGLVTAFIDGGGEFIFTPFNVPGLGGIIQNAKITRIPYAFDPTYPEGRIYYGLTSGVSGGTPILLTRGTVSNTNDRRTIPCLSIERVGRGVVVLSGNELGIDSANPNNNDGVFENYELFRRFVHNKIDDLV